MMTERNEKHGTLHRAVDKTSDALGGIIGRAAANTAGSASAASFVENAAIGDMYEIAAAKVALQHAQSDLVKAAAHSRKTQPSVARAPSQCLPLQSSSCATTTAPP